MRIVVNESIARLRKRGRSAEVIRLDGETEPDNVSEEAGMNESTKAWKPERGND